MNRLTLLFLGSLLILSSCNNPDGPVAPVNPSANVIMPLGASRVDGARPVYESYRYELWKLLVDGGHDFDYIGTVEDESSYPSYASTSFDLDHEGRGGWTSGQILAGISDWLQAAGTPDIVLFSSPGGNDALQNLSFEEAVSNVNAIIDILQEANPEVVIIIEQMAPAQSAEMVPPLSDWFALMQEEVLTVAANQSDESSRVIAVDMFTDFGDALLADEVHYNEAGAKFIANRYYAVLKDVLE